ncbi:putative esterase of the alpha-beta hydrolase superfamily, partial [Xylona heveae TC161]
MAFLQRPNGCHHREDVEAVAPKKNAKTTCAQATGHGSTFLPLLRLVRDPAGAVASAIDALRPGSNSGLSPEEQAELLRVEQRRQILYAKLRNASNSSEWHLTALELDILEHNDEWKEEFESPDYDALLVELRLKELDDARISCDVGRMLAIIRTSLTRGLGDMGNIRLYMHSHTGTKRLIERYISSALATLKALLDISANQKDERLAPRFMLEQVLCARQAFGRSALLLSGGGTFGMNHIGVLKSLWEAHLLPRIISGASAGSIVSAVICTRTDEEIPELLDTFCYGDLSVFERPDDEDSALRRIGRFLKIGALFDITHLTRVMRDLLGDLTFQEGYNRTRRILNICVSSASLYELPRLLNYVSAPNVLIWSAVAASCSVPFVFSAASLLAKDPKTGEAVPWNPTPQHYIDGSVDNDLPMTRLAEMFNVNHFIVSQVNPHVVPFLVREEELISAQGPSSHASSQPGPGWLYTMTNLAKTEALHRLNVLADLGFFPTALSKVRSVLNQRYSGDITILPEISYADFHLALTNPTPEFMLSAMLTGERATWPKLSRIRNHCAIELALDDAVQKLRTRVVFSPSQMDLRL